MPGIRSNSETSANTIDPLESRADLVDLDEISQDMADDDDVYEVKKERSARATSVRRRIEEQLEVRMLRDELGMDDFEL